jgi:hypothetical protein
MLRRKGGTLGSRPGRRWGNRLQEAATHWPLRRGRDVLFGRPRIGPEGGVQEHVSSRQLDPGSKLESTYHRFVKDNIFSAFAKHERPLSSYLNQDVNGLVEAAARAESLDELDRFVGDRLAESIGSCRRELPALGEPGPPRRANGAWREIAPGHRIPTTRFFLTFPVLGESEVLAWWPDKTDAELRAANQDFIDRIGGYEELRKQSDEVSNEYFATIDIWILDSVNLVETSVGLTTYADLTQDEIEAAAASNSLRDLFERRRAEAEAIVAAIREQMTRFYEEELPRELVARADANRRRLENIYALYNTLGLPASWKTPEPRIIEQPAPEHPVKGLTIHPKWRLEPVSYDEILGIVRLWAHAVENYPDAFSSLPEDRVSDLLAATLNATTSGAGREVF